MVQGLWQNPTQYAEQILELLEPFQAALDEIESPGKRRRAAVRHRVDGGILRGLGLDRRRLISVRRLILDPKQAGARAGLFFFMRSRRVAASLESARRGRSQRIAKPVLFLFDLVETAPATAAGTGLVIVTLPQNRLARLEIETSGKGDRHSTPVAAPQSRRDLAADLGQQHQNDATRRRSRSARPTAARGRRRKRRRGDSRATCRPARK